MLQLYVSLALLGLSSIDVIGLAAMPILLSQDKPFKRSAIFLGGSLTSLVIMGLLLSQGFGAIIIKLDYSNSLLMPIIETVAGVILIFIALFLSWSIRNNKYSVGLSDSIIRHLRLGNWRLFITGALLVATQSILDIVFVVAMIRVGQFKLSFLMLMAAVATYSVMALLLQFVIVLVYGLTSRQRRSRIITITEGLLAAYSNVVLLIVSLVLGCILLALGIKPKL